MLTVGQILKQEREKQNYTVEDVERNIHVRKKFIKALEEDSWSIFSSKIYIVGIIKNYAKFLGLPHDKVLAFFRREYAKREEVGFKTNVSQGLLTSDTRRFFIIFVFFICTLFIGYFSYQLKLFLSPPTITILSPTENQFKNVDRVQIIAKTDKESQINIFGNRIYQDTNGSFTYTLPLKKGANKLIVEVIGPNGKKTIYQNSYFLK